MVTMSIAGTHRLGVAPAGRELAEDHKKRPRVEALSKAWGGLFGVRAGKWIPKRSEKKQHIGSSVINEAITLNFSFVVFALECAEDCFEQQWCKRG